MRYISHEDDWMAMFEYFKDETDPLEKNKLMKGLAGIKSTEILKELVLISLLSTTFFIQNNNGSNHVMFFSFLLVISTELWIRKSFALKIS